MNIEFDYNYQGLEHHICLKLHRLEGHPAQKNRGGIYDPECVDPPAGNTLEWGDEEIIDIESAEEDISICRYFYNELLTKFQSQPDWHDTVMEAVLEELSNE